MNVTQYLAEMRAAGYRFYVTQHPAKKGRGILTMFPDQPESDQPLARFLELEAWRRSNVTTEQFADAILASEHNQAQIKRKSKHV